MALEDTFTGANGTLLTAHTADSGHTWEASGGSTFKIQSNGVFTEGNNNTEEVLSTFSAKDSEGTVEFEWPGDIAGTENVGVSFRGSVASAGKWNAYEAVVTSKGELILRKFVNSATSTTIKSGTGATVKVGETHTIGYEAEGSKLKLLYDGVVKLEGEDTSFTEGKTGVEGRLGSTTAGFRITKITASELGGGGKTVEGKATIEGSGSLTASGTHIAIGKATITGTGSLTSAGTRTTFGRATVSGSGTLSGAGTRTTLGQGAIVGTSSITGAGQGPEGKTVEGKATIAGSGTLSATGLHTGIGKASIAGSSTVSGTGLHTAIGKATISGTSTLTSAGTRITSGKATIAGTSSFSASGAVQHEGEEQTGPPQYFLGQAHIVEASEKAQIFMGLRKAVRKTFRTLTLKRRWR